MIFFFIIINKKFATNFRGVTIFQIINLFIYYLLYFSLNSLRKTLCGYAICKSPQRHSKETKLSPQFPSFQREIIMYSYSTINAHFHLSHKWWVILIKFIMEPTIHVGELHIYGTPEILNNFLLSNSPTHDWVCDFLVNFLDFACCMLFSNFYVRICLGAE